jgi:deoxyribodipyrimidine photo-lyase
VEEEVGTPVGTGEVLQRTVPPSEGEAAQGEFAQGEFAQGGPAKGVILRREFASRDELAEYLCGEFAGPAQRDATLSPIPGGARAAETALEKIDPSRYGFTRNYLDGAVSRLSPYIRHGVLTLSRIRDVALARVANPFHAAKFLTELAWRDYWRRIYRQLGDGVWIDREEYKTGWSASDYRDEIPAEIEQGRTGLACMDAFATELARTGYLHNHARMWVAAYVVHWRRVKWQAGARWFLKHLLDGDPASNNLSWQWVASTFSRKPYFFNRENLEKYSGGRYCGVCPARGECDFEGSYETLARRLFRVEVGR